MSLLKIAAYGTTMVAPITTPASQADRDAIVLTYQSDGWSTVEIIDL